MVLPARLDLERTLAYAWQTPSASVGGPDFSNPRSLQAGDLLSLSASTYDVIQVPSQAAFDTCATNGGVLLHDFRTNGSAFDIVLNTAGVYLLTTTNAVACANGLKLRLVVGSSTQIAPFLPRGVTNQRILRHATCTIVSNASGSTTFTPTATPSSTPTSVPSAAPTMTVDVNLGSSSSRSRSGESALIAGVVGIVLIMVIAVVIISRKTKRKAPEIRPTVFNAYTHNETHSF